MRAGNTQELTRHILSIYAAPFIGAYLLTLVTYSYFFTGIVFSDHTFPNVWVFPYPSYTTLSEGRWFADLLFMAFGGSGVQSLQMATATALNIVNAFILASLLGVSGRLRLLLVATLLSLHPAFLDYYSYTMPHMALVTGDTLALLAALALDRMRDRRLAVSLASLGFLLTLATHQPKIALIALLLLISCIRAATVPLPGRAHAGALGRCLLRIRDAILAFGTALALYLFSLWLTLKDSPGPRTWVNNANQIATQLMRSYRATLENVTIQVDYLPAFLAWLPAAVALLGVTALLLRARRGGGATVLLTLALVALIPPALRASYIVNHYTAPVGGRFLSSHAYALIFLLVSAWSISFLRHAVIAVGVILTYCFAVVASQETNAAALQTIYDLSKINRVAIRIEDVVPDLYEKPRPVVVVGALPLVQSGTFKRHPNSLYRANTSESFAGYRQVEILNFFLGRPGVTSPKKAEIDAALADEGARRPWPAPESVFMKDGVVVVLLEAYAPGVRVTLPWPRR